MRPRMRMRTKKAENEDEDEDESEDEAKQSKGRGEGGGGRQGQRMIIMKRWRRRMMKIRRKARQSPPDLCPLPVPVPQADAQLRVSPGQRHRALRCHHLVPKGHRLGQLQGQLLWGHGDIWDTQGHAGTRGWHPRMPRDTQGILRGHCALCCHHLVPKGHRLGLLQGQLLWGHGDTGMHPGTPRGHPGTWAWHPGDTGMASRDPWGGNGDTVRVALGREWLSPRTQGTAGTGGDSRGRAVPSHPCRGDTWGHCQEWPWGDVPACGIPQIPEIPKSWDTCLGQLQHLRLLRVLLRVLGRWWHQRRPRVTLGGCGSTAGAELSLMSPLSPPTTFPGGRATRGHPGDSHTQGTRGQEQGTPQGLGGHPGCGASPVSLSPCTQPCDPCPQPCPHPCVPMSPALSLCPPVPSHVPKCPHLSVPP